MNDYDVIYIPPTVKLVDQEESDALLARAFQTAQSMGDKWLLSEANSVRRKTGDEK